MLMKPKRVSNAALSLHSPGDMKVFQRSPINYAPLLDETYEIWVKIIMAVVHCTNHLNY